MMTPAAIDQLIDDHFRFEATDDIEGVLASLTEDVEHHVIPSPMGPVRGRDGARAFYKMHFAGIEGEGVTPVKRLYGDGFVVDEVIWSGQVKDGRVFLCDGLSGPASFRMLHIFEFEGDRISSEKVWCDLAAIQAQLSRPQAAVAA
jgi:hypothetical protein